MAESTPILRVLAGTNGAGKSSIGGAFVRATGGNYFNPDEITQAIRAQRPDLSEEEANSLAWQLNVRRLKLAIAERRTYAFETTLGGNTIPALIAAAVDAGLALHLWYAGLDSPERHLARIAARVARGGHDIPEAKVRERYRSSLINLIALLPRCTELEVYDNSAEQHPDRPPEKPKRVLMVRHGRVEHPRTLPELQATPVWAKPVVTRAYQAFGIP
jgi:predicted ABC-type ATPase